MLTNDGLPFSKPHLAEAACRQSREALWTILSAFDPALASLWRTTYQAAWVRGRCITAKLPDVFTCLMAIIRAGSSAPGLDGTPYEAWQVLPQLLSRILEQWFWDAMHRPWLASAQLATILDLIIFIPKSSGSRVAGGKRPLAMPPCHWRTLSSAGMSNVSPIWSAMLHQSQASGRKGMECATNVKHILQFLEGGGNYRLHPGDDPFDCISNLLPPATLFCLRALISGPLCDLRARLAMLVDQWKAYEIMSHEWMQGIWAEWQVPVWVWIWLNALVVLRHGRIGIQGFLGPVLTLVKGLGMGGPHAPFAWNVGFDPILVILSAGSHALATSVWADDTALAVNSVRQAITAQLLLLATRSVAGLQIATHHCHSASLQCRAIDWPAISERMSHFPLCTSVSEPCSQQAAPHKASSCANCFSSTVNDQTASITSDLGSHAAQNFTLHGPSIFILQVCIVWLHAVCLVRVNSFAANECTCDCKCDMIFANPASAMHSAWLVVPWGHHTHSPHARYLGPVIAGDVPTRDPLDIHRATLSLTKPLAKVGSRVWKIQSVRQSWATRTYGWNVYCLSCVTHVFRVYMLPPRCTTFLSSICALPSEEASGSPPSTCLP